MKALVKALIRANVLPKSYPAAFTVTSSGAVGGTASKGTATVTITKATGGGGGGVINASLATARVSGVAPLYVNFDATGTTSTASTNPMHELLYAWNFGDSGAGNWVNGVQSSGLISKNTDYGPVTGHVYETPGTYTVNLTIMDGVNTATSSVTITVADPNTVYAGSNTICFSQNGTFTGAPSGATLINTAGSTDMYSQWTTYAASNKRLLWNKSQSWIASNYLIASNLAGLYVGGFGTGATFGVGNSGASPSGTGVPVAPTWSSFGALFTINANCTDLRFCEFIIAGNAAISAAGINNPATQILWYKIEIGGHSEGWNAFPGGGIGVNNQFDQHALYECRGTGTIGSAFVDDGATGNSGGCNTFTGHTRGGMLGCYWDNNNHGEQTVRLPYLYTSHINHNYIARPNQTKNVVKIHSYPYNETPLYTDKFVFSSNLVDMRGGYIIGATTSQGHTVTSTGSGVIAGNGGTSGNERIRGGLFENNYTYGTRGNTQGLQAYAVGGPNCTIRNNIIDLWCGNGNGSDTSATGVFNYTYPYSNLNIAVIQNSTPDPTVNVACYNNTLYSNASNCQSMPFWLIGSTTANITLKNNLVYAPYQTSLNTMQVYNPDGATGVVVSNSTTNSNTNPNFTATPPVALTDWKPATGSYAINSGATVPVLQDFFRASRTGTYSMGAVLP